MSSSLNDSVASLFFRLGRCAFPLFLFAACVAPGAQMVETDVCVYGGAAGGVAAAVQVARSGKSVALLCFNNHLGGMSSSGLGQTDIGSNGNTYIQGMAREFYTRIGAKYSVSGPKWTFEPRIAETVFNEMLREAGVSIYLSQRLASATMAGGKITEITMDNGNVFRAKMFIDASYEGDLLKRAGVSYTVGREANSQYGETLNGIQTATSGNQLPNGIDPYVVQGDPASGLLPGVNATAGGPNGSADSKIQAYCYRMCLTNNPANRVMVSQPPGYNEADYELLFRSIEAGQTTGFFKTDAMPNSKTDSNNSGGISTDFIGMNYDYPEADYATRATIAKAHENWQRGLIWTLQNHSRVPQAIRDAYAQWGLPADEFVDNNHWPYELYVREARRMVSDYVMTEKNCVGSLQANDSVGLAAYVMDSHNCQRIVSGGFVKNEGDVQRAVPAPFPVSYRSLVPKAGECANLLVPWCLSATHVAFASVRMEPVFMILGQSAAAAASIAIDDGVAVQEVSYPKLRAQLLADGQALGTAVTGVIVDNADATGVTITGSWTASAAVAGFYGADYISDGNSSKGAKSVRFTPEFASSGDREVFLRWTANANRASNVPVDIISASGTSTVVVNQQLQGGTWVSVGVYSFNSGTQGSVLIRNTSTNGYVVADAVQFAPVATSETVVQLWAGDAEASEFSETTGTALPGRVVVSREGNTSAPLTVNLAIGGSAVNGTNYTAIPASVTIGSGSSSAVISITPQADFKTTGDLAAVLSLAPGSGYTIGSLSQATVTIRDRGYDPKADTSWFVQKLRAGVPQKIVGYGTSLTAGVPYTWLTSFTAGLEAAYPGLVTVVNSGGSGQNSDWGVTYLQSKVISHAPDAVFIEFATNDAVNRFNLSPAHVRSNVENMVDRIRAALPECEIVFQIMNPVINSMLADTSQRPDLQRYQQIYRDVAAARGLKVVDHMPAWQALLDSGTAAFVAVVPDGLHPNEQGFQTYVAPTVLRSTGVTAAPSLVIDNSSPAGVSVRGTWVSGTTPRGYIGTNFLSDNNASKGSNSVTYSPTFAAAGVYPVYLRWTSDSTRATNVPVEIVDGNGTRTTLSLNQQQRGGQWVLLGNFPFSSGASGSVTIRNELTNGGVAVDAVGFDVPGDTRVSIRAGNGLAAEPATSSIAARSSTITISRAGATTDSLTVGLACSGSAINGQDYATLPASVTIPAGESVVRFELVPFSDDLPEGDEQARISVVSQSGYTLAGPATVTVAIQDRPMDAWRFRNFTSEQLADGSLDADEAAPAGDGVSNLVKYALGLAPNTPAGGLGVGASGLDGNGRLELGFTRTIASDIECHAEVSADLIHWSAVAVQETILSDDGLTQSVLARDVDPIGAGERRFIRLRVNRLR